MSVEEHPDGYKFRDMQRCANCCFCARNYTEFICNFEPGTQYQHVVNPMEFCKWQPKQWQFDKFKMLDCDMVVWTGNKTDN